MPVTIVKAATKNVAKKIEAVETTEPSELSDDNLADLYGGLQDKIEALRQDPIFAQFAEAEAELKKRLDPLDATSVAKFKGKHWLLDIGMCSKSPRKIIDNVAVAKFVGKDVFNQIAKVSVGDAEKYLTPDQLAKVASKEAYTKNRKITASFLG